MKTIKVTWADFKKNVDDNSLDVHFFIKRARYHIHATNGPFHFVHTMSDDDENFEDFSNNYKPTINPSAKIQSVELLPFAKPTYRTKNDAILTPVSCAINATANIDFELTVERYVSGGSLLVQNAVFGDYITACVEDINGVIPEPYRAAICEDHPCIAEYIIKEFVEVLVGGISIHKIDTTPLNAKITAGLFLRITYHAINSGTERSIAVNYSLTKKL